MHKRSPRDFPSSYTRIEFSFPPKRRFLSHYCEFFGHYCRYYSVELKIAEKGWDEIKLLYNIFAALQPTVPGWLASCFSVFTNEQIMKSHNFLFVTITYITCNWEKFRNTISTCEVETWDCSRQNFLCLWFFREMLRSDPANKTIVK